MEDSENVYFSLPKRKQKHTGVRKVKELKKEKKNELENKLMYSKVAGRQYKPRKKVQGKKDVEALQKLAVKRQQEREAKRAPVLTGLEAITQEAQIEKLKKRAEKQMMSPEEVQELLKKQREELESKQLRLGQIKQQAQVAVTPKKPRVMRKYGLDISTLRKPALVAIAKALGKTGTGSVANIGKQINEALSASGEVVWDLPDIKAILEREKEVVEEKEQKDSLSKSQRKALKRQVKQKDMAMKEREKEVVEEKEQKDWLSKSQRKALKRQLKQEDMAMKEIDTAYKEAEKAERKAQQTGKQKDIENAQKKRRAQEELVEKYFGEEGEVEGQGLHPLVGGALFAHDLIHRQSNDLLNKHSNIMLVDALNKVKKMADQHLLKVAKTHGGGWASSLIKPMVNAGKSLSSVGSSVQNMIAPTMKNTMNLVSRGMELAKPLLKEHSPDLVKKAISLGLNFVPMGDTITKALSPHIDKLVDAGVSKLLSKI